MAKQNNTKSSGYKSSTFGLIPIEWSDLKISDVILFSGGSQPPQKVFIYEEREGYVRLIQTRDYRTDKYKTYIPINEVKKSCTKDDIMIGRYGPPIFQIFRGLQGAYNVALIKATPKDNVNKDYCYYFLSRPELRKYLEGLSQRSGGQTGIDIEKLNEYPFPLPTYPEQIAIANLLGVWDKAIQNTKLIINCKELRKNWLMQVLLTGKKRLKGYEKEKWVIKKISSIATEISIKNKEDKDLVVLSCTKYDGLVPSLEYFGRKVYSDDLTTYKVVPKYHFAYATNHIEEGSIGYQLKYDLSLISPMYTVFKANESIDDIYLYRVLKSQLYIHEYKKRMEGSIDRRGGLRWDQFAQIKVPVPSIKEQNAISDFFGVVDREIELLQNKLNYLKEQKKGLMQVLLTGKKRLNIK